MAHRRLPVLPHDVPQEEEQVTIAEDLDLDVNANDLSCAGHQCDEIEESDSLNLLPQPEMQATQLAKISLLRQGRFESWEQYYSQGSSLVEALPDTFEEMVVRKFADGIFQKTHRKQCQQWLQLKGWDWANVATFGDLWSPLARRVETGPFMDTARVSSSQNRDAHMTQSPQDIDSTWGEKCSFVGDPAKEPTPSNAGPCIDGESHAAGMRTNDPGSWSHEALNAAQAGEYMKRAGRVNANQVGKFWSMHIACGTIVATQASAIQHLNWCHREGGLGM